MSNDALLKKLAVERCQHHLAQIRAVIHLVNHAEGRFPQYEEQRFLHDLLNAVELDLHRLDGLHDCPGFTVQKALPGGY